MRPYLIVLSFFFVHEALAVDIVAHRGYACRTPENTLKSVRSAWLAGADGVELDLRVSMDGVIFLYHDDTIHNRPVSKLNYAEIRLISEHVAPTFKSILELSTQPGFFILDLKDKDPNHYRPLATLVATSGISQDRFIIQGPSVAVLKTVREYLPDAGYYYLTNLKRKFPFFLTPNPQRVLKRIDGFGFDGVSLKGRAFLDRQFIDEIKGAGYKVNVWTINDPSRASFYRDIGVDGIITDFVEKIQSEVDDGKSFEGPCLSVVQDAS